MFQNHKPTTIVRRGLTLIELMIASAITTIIVGALVAIASTVQVTGEYSYQHDTVLQHARVTMSRINRMIENAASSINSPGVVVLPEDVGGDSYPDTLVIWREDINSDGKPQFNELTVYCPDPDVPNKLYELDFVVPADCPKFSNPVSLKSAIDPLKNGAINRGVVLTERLRTAAASNGIDRGCIRFDVRVTPSAADYIQYQASAIAWEDLPWVQGIYGSTTGMRQAWVRYEIQLMPDETTSVDSKGQQSIPFFGSAALYDQLPK